jgi:tetratricopeptide (TPR) repeat protein
MGKHTRRSHSRAQADRLREDLDQCERWVVQIGRTDSSILARVPTTTVSGATENRGLLLLRLLDQVADELEFMERRGADLRAERGRFETVLNQLRRRERALVAQVGTDMAAQRPPNARWWWYLNEKVAADRKRLFRRVVGVMLIALILLSLGYLGYDRFLALPPHVRQADAHLFEGESAVNQGDLTHAIAEFEKAVALDPTRFEAHLWLGVLHKTTGNLEKAARSFEKAQTLLGSGPEFLLQRGLLYLTLNDLDAANRDATAAVELAPGRPEGFFLRGNAAEQAGDLELALASFQQAVVLAESTGHTALLAMAQVRIADVLQQLAENPQQ